MWIEVDESNLCEELLAETGDHLRLRASSTSRLDGEGDAGLAAFLEKCKWREQIAHVDIEWSCSLRSLRILKLFPNMVGLYIESERIGAFRDLLNLPSLRVLWLGAEDKYARDLCVLPDLPIRSLSLRVHGTREARIVNSCSALRSLGLIRWSWPDFRILDRLRLDQIHVGGGGLQTSNGLCCESMMLASFSVCKKLENLAGLAVPFLYLSTCNRAKFAGIDGRRLRGLELRSIRISEEGWLRNLPVLEELQMHGCLGKSKCIDEVRKATKLQRFMSTSLSDREVRNIVNACAMVSNGNISFMHGHPYQEKAADWKINETRDWCARRILEKG